MPTGEQDGKPKVPGLEHEKDLETVEAGQEKADTQLHTETEQIEVAVSVLESEIAKDIANLDVMVASSEESHLDIHVINEARAELERLSTTARGIARTFLDSVANIFYHRPKEMVQDYRSGLEAKALAIPDNPKIIQQITAEISAVQKKVDDRKRLTKLESELRQSWSKVPQTVFDNALYGSGGIGRDFKAKIYDTEVKEQVANILRLYNAAAKKDPQVWTQLTVSVSAQAWQIAQTECQTGNPEKLVEWWKNLGTIKDEWSHSNTAQNLLSTLTAGYQDAYKLDRHSPDKVVSVRNDFVDHVQATHEYVGSTVEKLAGAPELQTILSIKREYVLDGQINNHVDNKMLSVLSPKQLAVWSDLGADVKEFLVKDLDQQSATSGPRERAWRVILAHPEAASLSKECLDYITRSKAASYSNWDVGVKNFIHYKKNDLAELACTEGQEDFAVAYESYSLDQNAGIHLIDHVKSLPVAEAAKFVRSYADRLPWSLAQDPDFLRTVCGFSNIEINLLTVASFRNGDQATIAEHTDKLDTFTAKALLMDQGVYQNNLSNSGLFNFVLAKHDRADSATILALMKEKDPYTLMYVCAPALASSSDVSSAVALFKQVPGLIHDIAAALMGGYINSYGALKELQNPEFVLENFQVLGISAADVGGLIRQAGHINESKLEPLLLVYAEDPVLITTPEYGLLLDKASHGFLLANYGKLGLTIDNLVERVALLAADWRQSMPLSATLEAYTQGKVPLTEGHIKNILTLLKFDVGELGKLYKYKTSSPEIAAAVNDYYAVPGEAPEKDRTIDVGNQKLDQSLQDYFAFTDYRRSYFAQDKVVKYLAKNPDQGREVVSLLEEAAVWGGGWRSAEAIVAILPRLISEPDVRKSFQTFNQFIEAHAPDSLHLVDLRLLERITTQPNRTEMAIGVLVECLPLTKEHTTLNLVITNLDQLIEIPASKRLTYVEALEAVAKSPSQEVQRILEPLLKMLLEVDNPKEAYRKIESIFIKNNLPLVGKIYKIFEVLFPAARLDEVLQNSTVLSPYLKAASHEKRMRTIYTDLLRVHIESDNRSLRHYLTILKAGESACAVLDSGGTEEINQLELKKVKHFIAKLNTLFENSQLADAGESVIPEGDITVVQARETYHQLRTSLGAKEGQKTTDRIAELFLRPLGYQSIDEVLNAMKIQKEVADNRGRSYAQTAESGYLSINSGDLLKGVDAAYIDSVLQNGSVAKEYLGAGSSSDRTPFDTDLEVVTGLGKVSNPTGFQKKIESMQAYGYGDVLLVVKDRGQWQKTKSSTVESYSRKKYELFQSGVVSSAHHGIRTGFASTEIDYIICKKELEQKKVFSEIVKNGYYIPVVNTLGKILFTPEMYDKARQAFSGIEHYDGGPYTLEPTSEFDPQWVEVQALKKELPEIIETVAEASKAIRAKVEAVLAAQGIHLKESFDTSLLGAELLDTGSTGRHTNTAESFDFDLVLKLDTADEQKIATITSALKNILSPDKDESYGGKGGADMYQLRFFGATGVGAKPVDIDIAFVRKSGLSVYGSHDAVRDKLDNIKANFGEEDYKSVLANIITAKEMLKKAKVYKKGEHAEGGLGGIGVENWLLAHGGNLAKACEAFKKAAYNGINRVDLVEFKKRYEINDPGINAKFLKHDNFVELLTNEGYVKMVKAVDAYAN